MMNDVHSSKAKFFVAVALFVIVGMALFLFYSPLRTTIGGKATLNNFQIQNVDLNVAPLCSAATCSGTFRCDGNNKCRFDLSLISLHYIVAPLGADVAFMDGVCKRATVNGAGVFSNGACSGTGAVCDFANDDCTQELPVAPAVAVVGNAVAGDLDGDGCVNRLDIIQILPNIDFDCPSVGHVASANHNLAGDLNHDGCVNRADIIQILPNINFNCQS